MQGGAMYALERGLHMKWLAVLFAFFGAFASFGIGCATQVNSIAEICNTNFHIPPVIMGGVIADTLNALMAIPNIIAVLLLSNVVVADTKKYINHLDAVDDTPVPVVR